MLFLRKKKAELVQSLLGLIRSLNLRLSKSDIFFRAKRQNISSGNHIGVNAEVVASIIDFYKKVPPFYDQDTIQPLKIGGAWRDNFQKFRPKQLEAIRNQDAHGYEMLLSNFFRNELVSQMWDVGYFQNSIGKKMPSDFYTWLDAFQFITRRSADSLVAKSVGNPWGYKTPFGVIKVIDPAQGIKADSITNLIRLSHDKGGKNADEVNARKPTMLDLGSGFGGDVEKVARFYGGAITCILVDVPLNLTTAYAYLSSIFGLDACFLCSDESDVSFALSHQIDKKFIFVPSLYVSMLRNVEIDVLHNHGSLSEMDRDTIDFYIKALIPNAKFFHEINSAKAANLGEHLEIESHSFPIPETHVLLTRNPTWFTPLGHRYLSSVYMKR